MKKIITALKRIRLGQILTVFLAGVLLIVSTACSNDGVQANNRKQEFSAGADRRQEVPAGLEGTQEAKKQLNNPRPEVPENAATSPFKKGGMNEFSDVDPRNKSNVEVPGKAKALIDNAQRNVDQPGNVGDKVRANVKGVGKNLNQSVEDTKNKAQDTTEDLAKGTKRGVENAKDNTLDATRGLTRGAKRATDDAAQNTKETGTNLVEKAQKAIENTADFVQGKVDETAKGTQRNLDKAGNAID